MIEIIPTCVPRDVSELEIGARNIRPFANAIHVDIDDGIFAPHLTWPYSESGVFGGVNLSLLKGLAIEVHLMVEESQKLGEAFARAGTSRIIGHIEGFADAEAARAALAAWKGAGAREVGLGVLFQTPLDRVAPLIDLCDVVHLMTIATIGVQGIPYEDSAPARVEDFHRRFPKTPISVDGGVNESNIAQLVRAGATRFGVGSAIVKAENPQAAYTRLVALAESVVNSR